MGEVKWYDDIHRYSNEDVLRQVILQDVGREPYSPYSLYYRYDCARWVSAGGGPAKDQWFVAYADQPGRWESERVTKHVRLDPLRVDVDKHVAFILGEMPPAVYADWLEENGVDLPAGAFEVLRHGI